MPVHGPGFKFQGWPGNLSEDDVRVCFEINFSDRKEGLTVSSIICDHWQHSDILAMCGKVISSFVIFAVLDLRVCGCRP